MKENSGTKQYEPFSLVNVRETVHDRICLKLIRRQDFIPYKTSKGAVYYKKYFYIFYTYYWYFVLKTSKSDF